jgi:hypothetical protein
MSMQRGGMRGDELGVMVPLGGSGSEKELFRPPKRIEDISPASAMFIRGRIREDLAGLYGLAATLAGDHQPTLAFLANMTNVRLGVNGLARSEFLMGLSRMLVPTSMPTAGRSGNGHSHEKPPGKGKDRKNEDDE